MLFVQLGNVFQCLVDLRRHVFEQVTHVAVAILLARVDELLHARLIQILLQPRQIKLIVTETDQIEK